MKKIKRASKNKELLFEIASIIIAILVITLSLLADMSIINISDFIATKVNNIEDLFFNLFTVQASMATLSIAVVTIITGIVNDNYFGISTAAYITNIRPKIFKHNILIIFNLIITIINYVCVSWTLFNISIALFVLSVFVTILMVKGVYFVFFGKNKMKEKMYDYLLENYNLLLLDDLNKDIINGIDAGNSLVLKEDLAALKEIFEKEIVKSNYQSTETAYRIAQIIANAFSKIVRQNNSLETNDCLLVICELYEIANRGEKPLHLDLWDTIFRDFFKALENLTYEQLRDDGVFVKLHRELYKNLIGRDSAYIENSNLKYYSAWTYNTIIKERKTHIQDKEYIKSRIYDNVYFSLMNEKFINAENGIKTLLIAELSFLNKSMIDAGDIASVKKVLKEKAFYKNRKTEYGVVLLMIVIYLYYLSSREGLVQEKEKQNNAKLIINENKRFFEHFYYEIDLLKIVEEYYDFIQGFMYNWEHFENGMVKTLVIDKVVEDALIFLSLNKYWEKNKILKIVNIIASDSVFSLYNRYFSSENQNGFVKLYSDFNKIFAPNEKEDKIEVLKEVFDQQYKMELKKTEIEHKISVGQLNLYSDKIKKKISSLYGEYLSAFDFQNIDKGDMQVINQKRVKLIEMNLTYHSFEDDEIESFIAEVLHSETINAFIRTLGEQMSFEEIQYENKNKQSRLIELVTETGIDGDVLIGNRDEFWEEEDKDLLNRYTSNMHVIKYPAGYNFYCILDSESIGFAMENIQVEFEDLEWEYIKDEYCKEDNGKLFYNVTNDIYIPLEKSEIEQYVHNTKKRVIVYADIKYRSSNNKVGAGIQIVFD